MDKRRRIAVQNTLLAAGGGLVQLVILGYAQGTDRTRLEGVEFALVALGFALGTAGFIVAVASGWSARFRDRSLTLYQMLWAMLTCTLFMYLSTGPDTPFYFLLSIILIFGVFTLTPGRYRFFAIMTSLLVGLVMVMDLNVETPIISWWDAALHWLVFAVCTAICASLCYSIANLRTHLKTRNRELQEAMEIKDRFLANMSHELRTPINGISGMLELLQRQTQERQTRRYAGLARANTGFLLSIVNDVLDFSKAQAGAIEIERVPFDVIALVSETLMIHAAKAQEKDLELVLDVSAVDHPLLRSDPTRLRQILHNLILNAVKFTHEGTIRVTLSTAQRGQDCQLTLSVQDTGIGIPDDKQRIIFDAFSQADVSTTRMYGGTGLGLSIVRQLVELMGGVIDLDSREGAGSVFQVRLTVTPEPQPRPKVWPQRALLMVTHGATGDAITTQLRAWGAQVSRWNSTQPPPSEVNSFDRVLMEESLWRELSPEGQMAWCECAKRVVILRLLASVDPLPEGIESLPMPVTPASLWDVLDRREMPHKARSGGGLRGRVLLVEDNAVNREVALGLLDDLRLECVTAENGDEALRQLAKTESLFDLVLMDCQMPVMDGFEATRQIRAGEAGERHRKIPIIALTANAMHGDKARCLEAGMNDYLPKPIDAEVFELKLRARLDDASVVKHSTASQSPSHGEDAPLQVWNYDAALARVRGKPERLLRLIDLYFDTMPKALAELREALAAGDATAITSCAHAPKGVSANMAAEQLAAVLGQMESFARHGDVDMAASLMTSAEARATETESALKNYQASLKVSALPSKT